MRSDYIACSEHEKIQDSQTQIAGCQVKINSYMELNPHHN